MRRLGLLIAVCVVVGGGLYLTRSSGGGGSHSFDPPAKPPPGDGASKAHGLRRSALDGVRDSVGALEIRRNRDGEVVPGANVYFLEPAFDWDSLTETDRNLYQTDLLSFYRSFGVTKRADSAGRCRLTAETDRLYVIAEAPGLYGTASLDLAVGTSPQVVYLSRDRSFMVRVQDPRGNPVRGVDVALRVRPSQIGEQPRSYALGKTDDTGYVRVRHCQEYSLFGVTPRATVWATAHGCGTPPEEVDLLDPPRAPVVLRLPATGGVLVKVVDESGGRFAGSEFAYRRVDVRVFDSRPSSEMALASMGRELLLGSDGTGQLLHVALGRYLALTHPYLLREPLIVKGPQQPGAVEEIVIRIPARFPFLEGRLLAVDGRPFGRAEFQLCWRSRRTMVNFQIRTDQAGRFSHPSPFLREGSTGSLSIQEWEGPRWPAQHRVVAGLTANATGIQLGDVGLSAEPLLLSGTVRYQPGKRGGRPIFGCESKAGEAWIRRPEFRWKWLSRSRFEVRGPIEDGRQLRLVLQSGEFTLVSPIEALAGSRGLRIDVSSVESVEVTAVVGSATPWREIQLALEGELEAGQDPRVHPCRVARSEGTRVIYVCKRVPPGAYDLVCRSGTREIHRVPGLVVKLDRGTVGSHLCEVDLRGLVRSLRIKVTAPDGSIPEAAEVLTVDGAGSWVAHPVSGGTAFIRGGGSPRRILVRAPAHNVAERSAVTGDTEIALRSSPRLRIALNCPEIPADVEIGLSIHPTRRSLAKGLLRTQLGSQSLSDRFSVRSVRPIRKHVDLRPMVRGLHKVSLELIWRGRRYGIYAFSPTRIEVMDGQEEQEVELHVNPKGLSMLLNRIRRL